MAKIVVKVFDVTDPRGYIEHELEATVAGPLAVHKELPPYRGARGRWAITHIASGRVFTLAHTRKDALELAARLLPLAPWELEETALKAAVSEETVEEIAALCREYKGAGLI